ncbi:MAG TPA: glycosyltransferase family 39 protein [Terriglobales bacterium]|nr:glycosyltransferase family 39 protein [Terriglobales bacterium]
MKRAGAIAGWCALAWVTLLGGLNSFGFLGPDEPRYAAIARAMLRTHDFITPRLWGQPWFEKPVLFYWLGAASDWLHGGERLPNALLAVALCGGLWWFLRRCHSERAGVLAGFMGLTSAFVIGFGRAATTDLPLTCMLSFGLMALYLESAWSGVFLGLAALAKGPVAVVLAVMIWVAYRATQRRWEFPRLVATVAWFAAAAGPWYVAVAVRNPSFIKVFFWQHNVERFATGRFEHPQAFWFYGPVLLLTVFPWTGWLGLPLAAVCRRWRRLGWGPAWRAADVPLKAYLAFWCAVPVVFFSISQSKLPGYILPAVPAAIGLVAVCAAESWERMARWPLAISAVLAGLIPAALRWAPVWQPRAMLADPFTRILIVAAVAVLLLLALRRRAVALVVANCILVAVGVGALTQGHMSEAIDLADSGRPLAMALGAQCSEGLPRACGNVPLYTWRLDRGLVYSAQYYLQGELTAFPETAPPANAIVIIPRRELGAFVARFGKQLQMATLSRFNPGGGTPSWEALRVAARR